MPLVPRIGKPGLPVGPIALLAVLIIADVLFGAGVVSQLASWTAKDFGTDLLFLALLGVSGAMIRSVWQSLRAWHRRGR